MSYIITLDQSIEYTHKLYIFNEIYITKNVVVCANIMNFWS